MIFIHLFDWQLCCIGVKYAASITNTAQTRIRAIPFHVSTVQTGMRWRGGLTRFQTLIIIITIISTKIIESRKTWHTKHNWSFSILLSFSSKAHQFSHQHIQNINNIEIFLHYIIKISPRRQCAFQSNWHRISWNIFQCCKKWIPHDVIGLIWLKKRKKK